MPKKQQRKHNCPHCGDLIPLTRSESLIGYGPALKQCPCCGKRFFDSRVKELSFYTDEVAKERKFITGSSISLTLFGIGLSAIFGLVLYFLSQSEVTRVRIPVIIIAGPIIFFMGLFSIFKDMRTYKERNRCFDEEIMLSNERLKNPEYRQLVSNFIQRQKLAAQKK